MIMNILPKKLIINAYDLQIIGIKEFAWKYDFIFEVINILCENNCIILGGDVYEINNENGQISSTGDSWYFNKTYNKNDVVESCKKAIDYIKKHYNINGENFCYTLVYESCYTKWKI